MSDRSVGTAAAIGRPAHRLLVQTGEQLEGVRFDLTEGLGELFRLELEVKTPSPDLDIDAILGGEATFEASPIDVGTTERKWQGIVTELELLHGDDSETHFAIYRVVIAPTMWLLTQRRNYRIFQDQSELDIVLDVLDSWGITPELDLDPGSYQKRRYRVQYAETDFLFVRRMLEDIGVTFFFQAAEATRLVLSDAPNRRAPRTPPIAYQRLEAGHVETVSEVRIRHEVQPGRYTQSDTDYRLPSEFALRASAADGLPIEQRLEQYHHDYGAFWWHAETTEPTPHADDRGPARSDLERGRAQVARRLQATRSASRVLRCFSTAFDLTPGAVFHIDGHPRADVAVTQPFLVARSHLWGSADDVWQLEIEARFADVDYRPPLQTPKPKVQGVESATVVGPPGEEIHTDEFARVRIHFHWDREGQRNHQDSCWIPVSQPWGGTSFGALNIPRIGQEVIVDFLGGDPDRPVVTGRVFTRNNPVPYRLPGHKTISGLRSESSPRLPPGAQRAGMLGGKAAGGGAPVEAASPQTSPLGQGIPLSGEALGRALTGSRHFGALSPSSETHQWTGSELSFDDTQGGEVTYLQSQKDFHAVTKNHARNVVGNSQATQVGSDDVLSVGNRQSFAIGSDRSVSVGGTQSHAIHGDVTQQSITGNQMFLTQEAFTSAAKEHSITSADMTVIRVGPATTIVMTPQYIILQADDVFINPGREVTEAAMNGVHPLNGPQPPVAFPNSPVAAPMSARNMIRMLHNQHRMGDAATPEEEQALRAYAADAVRREYGDNLTDGEIDQMVDDEMRFQEAYRRRQATGS